MCLLLLRSDDHKNEKVKQSFVARWLEAGYRPLVRATVRAPLVVLAISIGGVVAAGVALSTFGRGFLPPFNEGALNIAAATAPGTSLEASSAIANRLEKKLVAHPAVTSVLRFTGRAEEDEHALDVNYSELEVTLDVRDKHHQAEILSDVRTMASEIPGLTVTVGQPISHRIDHMLSGVRTTVAVKLFGPDLDTLRAAARQAESAVKSVGGTVDVSVEQLTEVPHLVIRPRATELAVLGRSQGDVIHHVQMALAGERVGTWWERDRTRAIVARFPSDYLNDLDRMRAMPLDADGKRFVPLEAVATVERTMGPNLINRENVERRLVVSANISGRDVKSAVEDIQRALDDSVDLPAGYRCELGGEFESEAAASRTIVGLSLLAIFGMFMLLSSAFRSVRHAFLVMANLPLALVGGAVAVWITGGVITVASLVGFITLFGIASRNGIMMVAHYRALMRDEGYNLQSAVVEGSVHRLTPILMTALTAALALIPIAMSSGEPGHEIQGPMAGVILGGLLSATLLNLLVIPALFARFAGENKELIAPSIPPSRIPLSRS